ncbi:MAG: hypothetical protein M1829_003364 [Trizodia sp. TS-e1964]|nr:MAG: hypothetical protein M1829_003364 [Trizodia sp. TS-e1964]
MAAHAAINIDYIKEKALRDLLGLLEAVRGKKNLVLEQSLAGPINVFAKFSTLQDYGVDKVFWLETGNVDSSQKNVVFLIRGEEARNTQAVAEQIKQLQQNKQADHEFSLFCIPRRTLVTNKILESEGILGDVNISEFPLYFLPLEKDLLSLELSDSFSDLYLKKDPTATFLAARALMLIQQRHGLFPRIIGKGNNAQRLADLLLRMRSEAAAGDGADANGSSNLGMTPSSTIESLIIIDREVDFPTVLLTQLTYEGLLDEAIGIQNNQIEVEPSIIGVKASVPTTPGSSRTTAPGAHQGLKRKVPLDSSDKLYKQLRDANFANVGPILNKVARRLESDYESRHDAKSTSELREFVSKLSGFQLEQQSLKIHTGLAEEIMKHTRSDQFNRILEVQQNLAAGSDPSSQHDNIEELISRNAPLTSVLRLLCLESCISNGIRPKDLENFKRQILHAYGFQHLLTLNALEKLQMLHARVSENALNIPLSYSSSAGGKTNYTSLRKSLRLIVDEVNEQEPDDIAYVYSGYAPLSVRLVQCVIQKQYINSLNKPSSTQGVVAASSAAQGWRGFDDVLKSIRGKTFDEAQRGEDKAVRARQILNGQGEKKTVVVFFLGGITFTEISALRFVARKEEGHRHLIVATTSIINGNKMMEAAITEGTF